MRTSRSGAGARAGGVLDGGWLCAREVRERMGQAAGGRTGSVGGAILSVRWLVRLCLIRHAGPDAILPRSPCHPPSPVLVSLRARAWPAGEGGLRNRPCPPGDAFLATAHPPRLPLARTLPH